MGKILTLENLCSFFVDNGETVHFDAAESGDPIVVSVKGNFEESANEMPGMLQLKLKVCHTECNRNGSHISKENMEKAMPSLKYRPILAYIHSLEDGTEDFYAHNVDFVEDENGDEKMVYLERQVGCFTADEPYLEYDEDADKYYVIANAVIPEDYTSAADIIRRKNGTKVSCELVINELSYNAKEKYLDLIDFYFGATTLLGCDEDGNQISEGMAGARADIADFCHKKPTLEYQDKLIETLEKLNFVLESFNKKSEEGGEEAMTKFEELLAKYNVVVEDVQFEVDGLSDEELEAKFEELFGTQEETVVVEENEDESSADDEEVVEDCSAEPQEEPAVVEEPAESANQYSIDEDGNVTIEYVLSHEDVRSALYNLLYAENEGWFWVVSVFDDYFIYNDENDGKYYKRAYSTTGNDVALDESKVEVFSEWLTADEIDALSALKKEYAELKTFKDDYDAKVVKAKKDEIFAKAEYQCIADNEDFKNLVGESEKYSVEECANKADLIFAAHMKATMSFAAGEKPARSTVGINFNKKESKKGPYGNLFEK